MDKSSLNDTPYDLIISDLEGSISKSDKKIVCNWRSLSAENEDTYNSIAAVFHDLELLPEYQKLDTTASWDDFKQKLESVPPNIINAVGNSRNKTSNIRYLKRYLSLAACLLLISWFGVRFFKANDMIRIATGPAQQKNLTMPDGSQILLNQNTEILYNKNNYSQNRAIDLVKGEAYFDVVHSNIHPFRINASNFQIRDIGTSFNVKYDGKSVFVTVSSGVVSLSDNLNKHAVTLTANQKGIGNITSSEVVSAANDETNYKAWADHNFQFLNATVADVIKKVSEVYGARIVMVDNTIGTRKITLAFRNQDIDSVMSIIGQTMQLKIEKKANIFYLKEQSR